MPAMTRPAAAQRSVAGEVRLAVAKMKPTLGERRFEGQEPGERMPLPGGIEKAAPQRHVAAAFAVDHGAALSRRPQAIEKATIGGKPAGVQPGIATGHEAPIGTAGG